MPTYSLAEQRALVLRRLRVSDTSRFSPTKGPADYEWIDGMIQEGEEEFVRQTKCLRTYAIIQLKSEKRVYRAPKDMIDIMAAYYYDSSIDGGYKELGYTSAEKLNDEVSDWRTATGEPSRIYTDRKRGDFENIGIYPIPEGDGAAITFSNAFASKVTWICPLYTNRWDFGRVMEYDGTDYFVLSTNDTVIVDAEVSSGNILLEYYRLPYQRSEMPPESAKAISMYAAASLLSDNPEDSAEYKRAAAYFQLFQQEIGAYINRRKRPMAAQELRVIPPVWAWQKNMPFYKGMP
jgi:hypothetical protein